ncbi:MAG: site-2 protease family protein [Candidatus Woesearchaeota archaeon]
MDFQAKAAVVFIVVLALLLYLKRDKLQKQNLVSSVVYILMYRTKVGIKLMDRVAKRFPRLLHYTGIGGIIAGFIGMVVICGFLIKGTYDIFFAPAVMPSVAIVQPFAKDVPGTFYVPFFYLIISIFLLVIVHEASHGIMARLYNLKLKSSGLAFLGILIPIIPAAFVEPDEKKMSKRPRKQQLSILAAGPFSNIIFAGIILALVGLAVSPAVDSIVDYDGVLVTDIMDSDKELAAEKAGMQAGEVIRSAGGVNVTTVDNLTEVINRKSPGETIDISTNASSYELTLSENPENNSEPYMGLYLKQHTVINKGFSDSYGRMTSSAIMWVVGLLVWLYALNLGIGLFNLLPLPITDGGRMLLLGLERFFTEEKSFRIWKFFALLFIFLIIINLGAGFIR